MEPTNLDFPELNGGTVGLRALGLLGVKRGYGTQQDDAGGEEPNRMWVVADRREDYLSNLSPAAGSRS